METQRERPKQNRQPRNIPYSCQRVLEALSDELKLLTTEESIEMLGVSRGTFWKKIKEHGLTCYTIPTCGKRVFFLLEALETLMQPRPKGEQIRYRTASEIGRDYGVRSKTAGK